MSAAVASQRGSGCCDGTPAAGNGTRTDRERSREQGGVRVAGGGGRRGPVCLRSKSLNSLCTQSHAASMSPLIPSPSRRAGISCAGDARADRFSEHRFFLTARRRTILLQLQVLHLLFFLPFADFSANSHHVVRCTPGSPAPPCSRTPHVNARRTDAPADVRPVRPHRAAPAVHFAAVVCARHFSRLTAAGTSLSRGLWRRWIHAGVITATRRRYA